MAYSTVLITNNYRSNNMIYCIVNHKAKTILPCKRKLNAVYEHIKSAYGDKVGYYEYPTERHAIRKHKNYSLIQEIHYV